MNRCGIKYFFSILSGVTRELLMMDRFVILGFEYTIVLFIANWLWFLAAVSQFLSREKSLMGRF